MRKRAYFDSRRYDGWPEPREIESYFLAAPGKQRFNTGGNDTAGFWLEGADGTEHLQERTDRI